MRRDMLTGFDPYQNYWHLQRQLEETNIMG